jgi:hypothetical protein
MFKGTVSRDGSQDEPMEQKLRPKLMFGNPFFRLKLSIELRTHRCKTGTWDLVDFATTIKLFFVAYSCTILRAANVCRLIFTRTATT